MDGSSRVAEKDYLRRDESPHRSLASKRDGWDGWEVSSEIVRSGPLHVAIHLAGPST